MFQSEKSVGPRQVRGFRVVGGVLYTRFAGQATAVSFGSVLDVVRAPFVSGSFAAGLGGGAG